MTDPFSAFSAHVKMKEQTPLTIRICLAMQVIQPVKAEMSTFYA